MATKIPMDEMTIEQLRDLCNRRAEVNKKIVEEKQELIARVAELEAALAAIQPAPAVIPEPVGRDQRVVWAEKAVADVIAEIHSINRTADNSLIGLNSAEVDLSNRINELRNECPQPGYVKGVAHRFIIEPLQAEHERIQAEIARETLKVINS